MISENNDDDNDFKAQNDRISERRSFILIPYCQKSLLLETRSVDYH